MLARRAALNLRRIRGRGKGIKGTGFYREEESYSVFPRDEAVSLGSALQLEFQTEKPRDVSSRWQCRCRYRSVRASRSFSLSHPGPRTTHASAPDALPPTSPRDAPRRPRSLQFPSTEGTLLSLSPSLSSLHPLCHQPPFLASFRVVFAFSLSLDLLKVPTYRRHGAAATLLHPPSSSLSLSPGHPFLPLRLASRTHRG